MTNKILIPLIVVLSLITIGVVSLTQLNKSPEKVAVVTSPAIESSVKSQVAISSSSVQTLSSVVSSIIQKAEESKVGGVVTVESLKSPQYVQDYLNCPTKFSSKVSKNYFRLGIYKDTGDKEYRYLCVPENILDECSKYKGGTSFGFNHNKGYPLETQQELINTYGRGGGGLFKKENTIAINTMKVEVSFLLDTQSTHVQIH